MKQLTARLPHIRVFKKVDASRPELFQVLYASDNSVIRNMEEGGDFASSVEALLVDLEARFPPPNAGPLVSKAEEDGVSSSPDE